MDSGIGCTCSACSLKIPVLCPRLMPRLALRSLSQDEGDEVDEQPALHGFSVCRWPVAVQQVLHVSKWKLDVAHLL